jgi:hypothetical protein
MSVCLSARMRDAVRCGQIRSRSARVQVSEVWLNYQRIASYDWANGDSGGATGQRVGACRSPISGGHRLGPRRGGHGRGASVPSGGGLPAPTRIDADLWRPVPWMSPLTRRDGCSDAYS